MFPSSTPGSPPEASLEADVVHLAQEVRSEVQEAGVGVSRTPDGQNQRSQKVRACDLRQGGRTDFRVVFGERLNLDAGWTLTLEHFQNVPRLFQHNWKVFHAVAGLPASIYRADWLNQLFSIELFSNLTHWSK